MSIFTPQEMSDLRAPFPLDKHIVREGHSEGGKIRWFVYIDRSAVQDRLDEMFPGEWETTEPKMYPVETRTIKDDGSIETSHEMSATMGITIRGLTRWDGGESDDGSTKSAITNAFRRTAAYGWGIARYLYDMDVKIKTEAYRTKDSNGRWQTDWKKFDQVKQQAMDQFTQWYNRMFNVSHLGSQNGAQRSPKQALNGNGQQERRIPPQNTENAANANVVRSEGNSQFIYNRVELFTEAAKVKALADVNSSERNNTIIKMEGEGAFTNARDYQQCIELVIARINSPEHGKAKKAVGA